MKYLAIARTTVLAGVMYERDMLLRTIFMLVVMLVFINLWPVAFAANGQTVIEGFSIADIVWYMVITESIQVSRPQIAHIIDGEVRGGDVAYRLSKPYSYPLYHLATFLGEATVRLPAAFITGAAVAWIAVGPPPISLPAVVGLLVSLTLALTLQGTIEILLGLCAFWVEDTGPLVWIWQKFALTLGGVLLPLDFFPPWLSAISRFLPFAAVAYAPARVFVNFDWATAGALILSQAVWITLGWLAVAFVFGQATRRVVAHGG